MEDKKEFSEEEYEKIKGDKESFNKYHSSILQPLFYQVWDKLNRTFGLGEFSEEVRDLFSYVVLIDSINKEIINQDSGLDDKERNFHTIMKKNF